MKSPPDNRGYRPPEVSWRSLLRADWRGAVLLLLFVGTLLVLGVIALVVGPGPELTVM
jgi:hypothetical protein